MVMSVSARGRERTWILRLAIQAPKANRRLTNPKGRLRSLAPQPWMGAGRGSPEGPLGTVLAVGPPYSR
jgi:hypothetical protein